jgi:hypothetical protein
MKTIDNAQRRKIFALVKEAYPKSGTTLTADRWRRELQQDLGIESLSCCPAEKGLQLMNRLHRICGDKPPGVPQDCCGKVSDHSRPATNQKSSIGNRQSKGPAGGRPKGILEWSGDQHAQMTKVEALLADMELSWNYADSIAKRMFGNSVLRVDTLDRRQMTAVISALVKRQKKKGGRRYGRV